MSPVDALAAALAEARLVAIVRLHDHANATTIVATLIESGVEFLELTVERPEGFASLERAIAAYGEDATIGAGTVLSVRDVERVATLGARFIVSPHTDPGVIAAAHERSMLALPGALSPSEVAVATSAGARFVKLFPAVVGVAYLGALRGPFPFVNFVPTGGVTIENAPTWFDAGAAALAMGSNLVPPSGSLEGLAQRARRAVAATRLAGRSS